MNNGDLPATPITTFLRDTSGAELIGLTKREHFAAMAMQTLIGIAEKRGWHFHDLESASVTIGDKAALIADATLAALEKS